MLVPYLWRFRVALTATFIAVLAGLLRFVGLGHPKVLVFDELYYARGGYSLLKWGFEGKWVGEHQAFAEGDTSGLLNTADYVVHPPLGKLMIAQGMRLFGATPFGWRFSSALIGTVTVLLVFFAARLLLKSTLWGGVAGVFLAIDGQHIVQSRSALLDIFLAFFGVLAFYFLLLDRARAKRSLASRAADARRRLGLAPDELLPGMGPALGARWWRWAAIVALGCGVGVKWSGLYFAAGFLVLSALWDIWDRREEGVRLWHIGALVRSVVPAALLSVVLLPVTYLATWTSWFVSDLGWKRFWAVQHPNEGISWLPADLRSLAEYHREMFNFHEGLRSPHTYQSEVWTWMLQIRPTAYYYEGTEKAAPCGAKECSEAITGLGHPLLWWAASAALIWMAWRVFRRADGVALAATSGILFGWLPWFMYAERTVFTFYSVAFAPWVMITLAYGLSLVAQPRWLGGGFSRRGVTVVTAFIAIAFVLAAFLLPIWWGYSVPYGYWHAHMWLDDWV